MSQALLLQCNFSAAGETENCLLLDLQNSNDKQLDQGVQKLLVLIMIPIESIPQVYGFLDPSGPWILDFSWYWMG